MASTSPWRRLETTKAFLGSRILRDEALAVLAEQELGELLQAGAPDLVIDLDAPCLGARNGCLELTVDVWTRASRMMHEMARTAGIRYLHLLQPNQYVEGSKPLNDDEMRTAWDPKRLRSQTAVRGYPLLRRAGRELLAAGVDFHDMTMVFKGRRETIYRDDCCHLNQHGNEVFGEAVGALIADTLER